MKALILNSRTLARAFALLLAAAPAASPAAVYEHHKNSTLRLGSAFDPVQPFDDKSPFGCFKFKGAKPGEYEVEGQGHSEIHWHGQEVRTRSELYSQLQLSSSLSARFSLVKLQGSFSQEKSLKMDERNLVFIFSGRREYSREHQKGELALTLKGRMALLRAKRNKDPGAFYAQCGKEVATSRVRGSVIGVIYQVRASTAEAAERIRSSVGVKISNAQGQISLDQELKTVDSRATHQAFAWQTGVADDQISITSLIKENSGDFTAIRAGIQAAMDATTRETSPTLSLGTTQVDGIPAVRKVLGRADVEDFGLIDRELVTLLDRFFVAEQRAEILRGLTDQYNEDRFQPGARALIEADLKAVQTIRDQILEHSGRCLRAEKYVDCKGEIPIFPDYQPTRYLKQFVDFHGWATQLNGPHQIWNRYHWDAGLSYWPVAFFRHPELIDRVVLERNGSAVAVLNHTAVETANEGGGSLARWYAPYAEVRTHWCWEGNPREVCASEVAGIVRAKARAQESGVSYRFVIYTLDGNQFSQPVSGL